MNFKKLAMVLSVTAALCYMGCEDSTSVSVDDDENDQPVLSSESKDATGDNITSSESKDNTGGQEQAVSSSSVKEDNGAAAASSSDAAPASSAGTAPASSADVGPVAGPGAVVYDTSFAFDSTAFADMMKCDEEGATQNMMGAAVLVCTDGQWVYDSTATAAANKCDEEGATKTESMGMGDAFSMDMTYICKDGQWEMQMPDFGGMFGGDSTGGFPGGMGNWGDSSFTMPGGGQGGFPGGGNFGGGNFGGGAGEIPANP